MTKVELTCINCPLGCQLTALVENGVVTNVSGNNCLRGERYAKSEVTDPKRTVTSTVKCDNKRVSVKTVPEVPKDKIFSVMDEIHKIEVKPPIHIGTVIMHNIANAGSDLIATSES